MLSTKVITLSKRQVIALIWICEFTCDFLDSWSKLGLNFNSSEIRNLIDYLDGVLKD